MGKRDCLTFSPILFLKSKSSQGLALWPSSVTGIYHRAGPHWAAGKPHAGEGMRRKEARLPFTKAKREIPLYPTGKKDRLQPLGVPAKGQVGKGVASFRQVPDLGKESLTSRAAGLVTITTHNLSGLVQFCPCPGLAAEHILSFVFTFTKMSH